jgi:HK97 gp10 family phage protein
MADGVQFDIRGLDEIRGKMMELSVDLRTKGGRYALRKSAQLIRNAAKENAKRLDDPLSSADIAANITERWSGRYFRQTRGDMQFRIGVLGGSGGRAKKEAFNKFPGNDTRHWRQQEFGNRNHPAQPFMRRAMSENVPKAINTFIFEYNKAIDRALKRAQKVKK